MQPEDWAKKYAAMDKRIELKYQQLAKGEQIGKRPDGAQNPNPRSLNLLYANGLLPSGTATSKALSVIATMA